MAIIYVDPEEWEKANANTVQVDSDATDNKGAIDDIEQWAADNRFARTNEYWLRRVIRQDGKHVFRGICYRVTVEVQASNEAILQKISKLAEENPRPPAQSSKDG